MRAVNARGSSTVKRTRMAAIFNITAPRRKGCKALFTLQKRVHWFDSPQLPG
jgi:hypothetical protein